MHKRNSGTFLVMYVGNGIDGLGKKENSILLSYDQILVCPWNVCLYYHVWVMKQREHETFSQTETLARSYKDKENTKD